MPAASVTTLYEFPFTRKVTVPVGAGEEPAGAETTAVAVTVLPNVTVPVGLVVRVRMVFGKLLPVPRRAPVIEGAFTAVELKVSVSARAPVAVGVNVAAMLQVAAVANAPPLEHAFEPVVLTVKSVVLPEVVKSGEPSASERSPSLLRLRLCAGLEAPTLSLPRFS